MSLSPPFGVNTGLSQDFENAFPHLPPNLRSTTTTSAHTNHLHHDIQSHQPFNFSQQFNPIASNGYNHNPPLHQFHQHGAQHGGHHLNQSNNLHHHQQQHYHNDQSFTHPPQPSDIKFPPNTSNIDQALHQLHANFNENFQQQNYQQQNQQQNQSNNLPHFLDPSSSSIPINPINSTHPTNQQFQPLPSSNSDISSSSHQSIPKYQYTPLHTAPVPPPLPLPSIRINETNPAKMLTALDLEHRTLSHLNLLYSSEICRLESEAQLIMDLIVQSTDQRLIDRLNLTTKIGKNGLGNCSGRMYYEMYGKSLAQNDTNSTVFLSQQQEYMHLLSISTLPHQKNLQNRKNQQNYGKNGLNYDEKGQNSMDRHDGDDENGQNIMNGQNNDEHDQNNEDQPLYLSALERDFKQPQARPYIPYIEIHDDKIQEELLKNDEILTEMMMGIENYDRLNGGGVDGGDGGIDAVSGVDDGNPSQDGGDNDDRNDNYDDDNGVGGDNGVNNGVGGDNNQRNQNGNDQRVDNGVDDDDDDDGGGGDEIELEFDD